MHTITIVSNQWLGHERCGLAVGMRNIVNTIFEDLNFVRFGNQCVELRANFALSRGAHFMVMQFNIQPHGFHRRAHAVSDIQKRVDWRYWEVTTFNPWFVAGVAAFDRSSCHPGRFFRFYFIHCTAHGGLVFYVVENKKFGFRAKVGSITNTSRRQEGLCTFSNGSRISIVSLQSAWFNDIAAHVYGCFFCKRVDHCG